jgi:hypothetical protein
MGFAGPLKIWWRGDGIRRPAELIVARRWDSLAYGIDCGAAMGIASPAEKIVAWRSMFRPNE